MPTLDTSIYNIFILIIDKYIKAITTVFKKDN
jgi:hypothetical protein